MSSGLRDCYVCVNSDLKTTAVKMDQDPVDMTSAKEVLPKKFAIGLAATYKSLHRDGEAVQLGQAYPTDAGRCRWLDQGCQRTNIRS